MREEFKNRLNKYKLEKDYIFWHIIGYVKNTGIFGCVDNSTASFNFTQKLSKKIDEAASGAKYTFGRSGNGFKEKTKSITNVLGMPCALYFLQRGRNRVDILEKFTKETPDDLPLALYRFIVENFGVGKYE